MNAEKQVLMPILMSILVSLQTKDILVQRCVHDWPWAGLQPSNLLVIPISLVPSLGEEKDALHSFTKH